MQKPDFEASFGDFLERYEYDDMEALLFSLVRAAFRAGCEAAGGVPPKPQPVVTLLPGKEPPAQE